MALGLMLFPLMNHACVVCDVLVSIADSGLCMHFPYPLRLSIVVFLVDNGSSTVSTYTTDIWNIQTLLK